MKIRIANNSIRFRLKQPEVEHFSRQKTITEVLDLGPAVNEQLSFTLAATNDSEFSIRCFEQTITVNVPHQSARRWTLTDLVGLEEEIERSNGKILRIVIEKDFACLDKGTNENEGTYPNPKLNC